jgi:hypothetical protein
LIAFGSQRANGAELAIHLANAEDNEYVEIAEIRGAVADDLPGAFSEFEAKATALTNLEKYLYSLSINPDPRQGRLTRDQYYDYIERVESVFGMEGHDRAIVFHIKESKDGLFREHCHAVWNRTDVQNMRGVNISHDKLKLMQITREFAQDHGLTLPDGYYKIDDNFQQMSLHEKAQQNKTGLTKQARAELITDLWRTSDSPKAFVAALEDNGYMLATGNRPYVLVDTFGNMNALPKMITDKDVRTKDIRAFLQKDFPPESLSTVEEARAVAAQMEESRERIKLSQKLAEQKEILQRDQDMRRKKLQADIAAKQDYHTKEATRLSDLHGDKRFVHMLNSAKADMEINFRRVANAPTGLAGFLSRVTGMDAIRSKLHAYQDRKRETTQEQARQQIEEQNRLEKLRQSHEHGLEMLEMRRLENEQKKSFEREERSIAMAQQREKVAHYSTGYEHMPSVQLTLTPRGRMAMPAKAQRRHYAPTVKEDNVKAPIEAKPDQTSKQPETLENGDYKSFADSWDEAVTREDEFYAPARDPDKDKGRGR